MPWQPDTAFVKQALAEWQTGERKKAYPFATRKFHLEELEFDEIERIMLRAHELQQKVSE